MATSAFFVEFAGGGVRLRAGQEWLAFDFDGNEVPAGEDPEFPFNACREGPEGEVCGTISPDGRWLLFWEEAGTTTSPGGFAVDVSDQWLLDVDAGSARLIQEGLVSCGGCDGVFGPRWSATSDFVVFTETGGDGRRWLAELTPGVITQIGNGQGIGTAPLWSPTGDQLLYNTPDGGTLLLDLADGTTRELPIAWPAAFDTTGAYAYAPAWFVHVDEQKDPSAPDPSTMIVDLADGTIVATLSGAAPYTFLWESDIAVAATVRGVVAVMQGAEGCEGTAIYLDADVVRCIEGGVEGQIGPAGLVAVARETGPTGHVEGPWGGSLEGTRFAIDIIHPDGRIETVIEGAISLDAAPGMTWNEAGTHLLVQWPRFVGL
jgi:hypothetical protein